MNGKERVDAVMQGRQPDRVPLMCQLSIGHAIWHSGMSPASFYLNYNEAYADTLVRLMCEYGMDGILVENNGLNTAALNADVAEVKGLDYGQRICFSNGNIVDCPPDDYPIYHPRTVSAPIPFGELAPEQLPMPLGYCTRLEDLPPYYMEPYRRVLEQAGQTHSIHGFVSTPYSVLAPVFGIEELMIAMIENPEQCRQYLEWITPHCIQWVDNLIDVGVHAVCLSAPYEGGGLISAGMYEEFALPYEKRLTEHIRARGAISYTHMCGSIGDRLDLIVKSGVDGIECLDPPPIGNVDLEKALEILGDRIFIKGNIDPVNTLLKASPQEVYADACKRIALAKGTNRYILSTACSVAPKTKAENMRALAKAVDEYGWYE